MRARVRACGPVAAELRHPFARARVDGEVPRLSDRDRRSVMWRWRDQHTVHRDGHADRGIPAYLPVRTALRRSAVRVVSTADLGRAEPCSRHVRKDLSVERVSRKMETRERWKRRRRTWSVALKAKFWAERGLCPSVSLNEAGPESCRCGHANAQSARLAAFLVGPR